MSADSDILVKNRILSALPAEEYKRLLPNLRPVTLEYKQVLYEPNKPIRYVYFPNDGVICPMVNLRLESQSIKVFILAHWLTPHRRLSASGSSNRPGRISV